MTNFDYQTPTRLIFGKDVVNQLPEVLKPLGQRVLITYGGGSIKRIGLYAKVMELLKDFDVFELPGIEPNPKYSTSVVDGVRLCKAKRYRYANANMAELEECLKQDQEQRFRIIATDGVFSMDGNVAPMDKICDLAEKYNALVMVDESHSAGVVGPTGHGTAEQFNLYGRIDIFTGTLGKAFGGAMGGFTTGRKEIIDMLRQRSRPYLFSNSIAPSIVGASIEMFKMLKESDALHTKLVNNVNYFRDKMMAAGFDIKPTQSAICAVMLYDAKLSQDFAARMQEEGIYVTGFYYPVVPKGEARIRVQLSAGHEREHLDKAIAAFIKVGKELNVIK